MARRRRARADVMPRTPAKSIKPACSRKPPPHTMRAKGQYTRIIHAQQKRMEAKKRTRPAYAPMIRQGVIAAYVEWKVAYRASGTPFAVSWWRRQSANHGVTKKIKIISPGQAA